MMEAYRLVCLAALMMLLGPAVTLPAFAQQTGRPEEPCLEVQVLDPSSASIQGAAVTIGDREERTDSSGVATICDLGPGPHRMVVSAENFQAHKSRVEPSHGRVIITLQLLLETELVVVGSRAQPRSVTKSPVPIDAIPLQDVVSQGSTTLDYQLRTLVPSFNVATHPISDTATLVRPVSLRNLAHDHTLVLVNGKRRHRSSVIAWFAGVTDGAQGLDISTIPAIALRQVEVLRDGASAQYGSDAIAGVLNFQLKDARQGGSVEFNTGTYRAGDGDSYAIAGNIGLPLGKSGFANLSLEYGNSDPTNRSVQRAARRRGGPHRGRKHGRGQSGPNLGQPHHRRRREVLRQLRPPVLQRRTALRPHQLRREEGDGGLLLPKSQQSGQHLQPVTKARPS